MKEKILIVEDQFIEANNLQMILERAGYIVCGIARSVPVALSAIEKEHPDMVLLDIFLQGPLTGIDLARTLRSKNIAFIYLSANSNKETLEAAKATRPYGFLVKPFREKDVLVTLEIARYLHQNSLESIIRNDQPGSSGSTDVSCPDFKDIIGESPLLKTVLRHVELVAPADTSVLILGESGTGKEQIANAIHQLSSRRNARLVKVNCAALPESLIESTLFGHEPGAFTGATERKCGKFELADEGTIFLDEIGEIPLDVQAKLLRVLQEKEIERLGGNTPVKINTRIITATNRNMEKEVAEGRFRMDLYYRLNVFPLQLPALRERKEDIPLLARHFLKVYNRKLKKAVSHISDQALDTLVAYDWPGNIRELEHTIERALLLCGEKVIPHFDLPEVNKSKPVPKVKTIEENEREHILSVLKLCGGRIFGDGGAAALLNMNVSTLNSRIKKLGIEKIKS